MSETLPVVISTWHETARRRIRVVRSSAVATPFAVYANQQFIAHEGETVLAFAARVGRLISELPMGFGLTFHFPLSRAEILEAGGDLLSAGSFH